MSRTILFLGLYRPKNKIVLDMGYTSLRNVGLPCGHAAGGNRASAHL